MGAMRAAEKAAAGFDAVADDFAPAVIATGSQGMNRAFETVKVMRYAIDHNFNGLVILVSTGFTTVHN